MIPNLAERKAQPNFFVQDYKPYKFDDLSRDKRLQERADQDMNESAIIGGKNGGIS